MKRYTHIDGTGMRWRFNGSRPVSELADKVMADVNKEMAMEEEKVEGGKVYIIIGPYCWAKSPSIKDAWKVLVKEWPSSEGKADKARAKFYEAPKTIYVNDLGGLSGPVEDHRKIKEVDSEGNPKGEKP